MNKLTELTLEQFCAELGSSSPAPGGGSASALAGAIGASLAAMVASLTVGKKKYVVVKAEMQELKNKADALSQTYLALINQDTTAFNEIMAAYKLPKATDDEKKARSKQIQVATKIATQPPLAMARQCSEILELCLTAAKLGNKNALSDAGVGAGMAAAAFRGAVYNVKINLSALNDQAYVAEIEAELKALEAKVTELSEAVYAAMEKL